MNHADGSLLHAKREIPSKYSLENISLRIVFSHNQYFDNLTFNPSSSSLSGIVSDSKPN